MKLLVASANPDKSAEMQAILSDLPVETASLAEFADAPHVVEDGETFLDNAIKKAREMALFSGLCTVADDSGLCVDALGGRPGVLSSRYAGPDPTAEKLCKKLLGEMADVPAGQRGACFYCFVALADPEGNTLFTVSGECRGGITREMRGTGGFGYDPVFLFPPAEKTFAEMTPDEKNRVSHRGRALGRFRAGFLDFLAAQGKP